MAYLPFPAKGGGNASLGNHPFQILLETAQSGIAQSHFDSKCPCDTGNDKYTSRYFFKEKGNYPVILNSGGVAFKIYSGSALYSQFKMDNFSPVSGKPSSYQGDKNERVESLDNCQDVFDKGRMTVFGLNRTVFISDFFEGNTDKNNTLKIWLTVCFPMGDPDIPKNAMDAWQTTDPQGYGCSDCAQRANLPMTAFISCGTGEWKDLVHADLVNKATGSPFPRLEKRQIAARVPIGEINVSGKVVAQYVNSNLTLQDMCLQGIPVKYPLSTFSEYYK